MASAPARADSGGATLNLFYEEPSADRWVRYDRYPRGVLRRLVRGVPRPGGQARVFLNLRAGLRKLGVPHRVNDYRHAKRHPEELACIIGKPCVLDAMPWRNPIMFGAAVMSHPLDDPQLLERLPIRRVLVPGPWMRAMCEPYWGSMVTAWPVGIDTEGWRPSPETEKTVDVLLYDKVLWDRERNGADLTAPIREHLRSRGLSVAELQYGHYEEAEYRQLLGRCRSMVFLCEHETQGIAYQQALSAGVPVFAWDAGGCWKDPSYYPARVRYGPVSSVPYWDARCGAKFADAADFDAGIDEFLARRDGAEYDPRAYVLEHLTLERSASEYVRLAREAGA